MGEAKRKSQVMAAKTDLYLRNARSHFRRMVTALEKIREEQALPFGESFYTEALAKIKDRKNACRRLQTKVQGWRKGGCNK